MVSCDRFHEAISARLDGEHPGVSEELLDVHLASCAGCRAYAERAGALNRQMRVRPADEAAGRDRTTQILTAINHERQPVAAGWYRRRVLARVGLAALALIQLAAALPATLLGHGGPATHSLRELGAFQLALAVGFLVASVRPARARGLLPVAATLVLCLAVVATLDIVSGHVVAVGEATHLVEFLGLGLLWRLSSPSLDDGAPQPA